MAKVEDISDDEILDAIRQRPATGKTPDELLRERYPFRIILRKMEQMHKRGLLEFGVSLRTAWIVPCRECCGTGTINAFDEKDTGSNTYENWPAPCPACNPEGKKKP